MKEQRPKLNRGEDPIRKRLRETDHKDVDALMRNTPTEQDELDEALPGAVERAREREMPLDQRKKARREKSETPAATTDDELNAFVDGLTAEQREHIHNRLVEHAAHDEGWTSFEFEEENADDEDEEAGDEL